MSSLWLSKTLQDHAPGHQCDLAAYRALLHSVLWPWWPPCFSLILHPPCHLCTCTHSLLALERAFSRSPWLTLFPQVSPQTSFLQRKCPLTNLIQPYCPIRCLHLEGFLYFLLSKRTLLIGLLISTGTPPLNCKLLHEGKILSIGSAAVFLAPRTCVRNTERARTLRGNLEMKEMLFPRAQGFHKEETLSWRKQVRDLGSRFYRVAAKSSLKVPTHCK